MNTSAYSDLLAALVPTKNALSIPDEDLKSELRSKYEALQRELGKVDPRCLDDLSLVGLEGATDEETLANLLSYSERAFKHLKQRVIRHNEGRASSLIMSVVRNSGGLWNAAPGEEPNLSDGDKQKMEWASQLQEINSAVEKLTFDVAWSADLDSEDKKKLTAVEKLKLQLNLAVIDYYNTILRKAGDKKSGAASVSELHYSKKYSKEQINSLYNYLKDKGYIEPMLFADFWFYFSGEGQPPFCKIKWLKGKTLLTAMLSVLYGGDGVEYGEGSIWKKGEYIFSRKDLAQSHSNALNTKSYPDKQDLFKTIIK